MSDGQLHLRVRSYEREEAWAPRYVANELAGTIQAADNYRATAVRRAAEAAVADDPEARARLQQAADDASALAEFLDGQAERLRELDDDRAEWYLHTAGSRVAAQRSQAELTRRHATDPPEDDRVTAAEWRAAHDQAVQAEDEHREITDEADFADDTTDTDRRAGLPEPDLREIAATEAAQRDEHLVRVPSADESALAIARAQRALREITVRNALDGQREAEERATQLNRWHADDVAAARTHGHGSDAGDGMDRSSYA